MYRRVNGQLKVIFLLLIGVLLSTLSTAAYSTNLKHILEKIHQHYQHTLPITAFTLSHHYLNKPYRSLNYWDHEMPNRMMSYRLVEIDMEKKHFYDNDVHYTVGGRLLDRVQFQNDHQSLFYEKNGSTLGKVAIKQSMQRFDVAMGYFVMNLDFIAVRPLLAESDPLNNIALKPASMLPAHIMPINAFPTHIKSQNDRSTVEQINLENRVNLVQQSDKGRIEYQFQLEPLRLLSVNHEGLGGLFVYQNYQTTRGITYARTIHQYYDGATEPNYIVFNDQFHALENVDANYLKLPNKYTVRTGQTDNQLRLEQLAEDLFLVADSASRHNILLRVNGDKITVFGGTAYDSLAERVLKMVERNFPAKTIYAVYVSHPHVGEINGLGIYADNSVKILADEYTISGIKTYPRFSHRIDSFDFLPLQHLQADHGAQYLVLENLHSKRQSFVYFEKAGIIFQSDFIHLATDGTIPNVIPSYTRTFIDFLRKSEIKFDRIVSPHRNNNISKKEVDRLYDALM